MKYDTGTPISDRRGGRAIHTWDLGLRGHVTDAQRRILVALITERRRSKWRTHPNTDGATLTYAQICETIPGTDRADLDDLVAKGYLAYRHPRIWQDGRRIADLTAPKGYDIAAGQLSFEITRVLTQDGIAPTLVPTDVSRLGVIVKEASE